MAGVQQRLHRRRVDGDHLPDEADVDRLPVDDRLGSGGGEQAAVLPRQADRPAAVLIDQADHLGSDLADQHHADDVDRLLGGDPQAAAELARDAEPGEHRGDLRAAAVHHDRVDAAGAEEHHVLGEGPAAGVVHHRVAAVLDHHDVAVELLEPRQRAGEDGDLAGVALGIVVPHDPPGADLLGQPPLRGRFVEPDVGRGGVLMGHVEYAEFSWT